jgi:type I restriction enzyme, S subunit
MSFKLTIGKLAILGESMATNEAIAALKPVVENIVDERYLFHYLSQFDFNNSVDRAAKGNTLNKAKLNRLTIRYPRELSRQRRIAVILDKAGCIRRKHVHALAMADELLKSAFLAKFGDPLTNPKGLPYCSNQRVSER